MIAATVVDHNQFWHVIIDHHKTQNLLMYAENAVVILSRLHLILPVLPAKE